MGLTTKDLTGTRIEYNGVLFGGAGTNMTPPEYDLQVQAGYDDANRAVVHLDCTLRVSGFIYDAEEDADAFDLTLADIRAKIMKPGKTLNMNGVGLGFQDTIEDLAYGPKPLAFTTSPVGNIGAEYSWTVSFRVARCEGGEFVGWSDENMKALNWSYSWSNDDRGITTRVTQGYAELVPRTSDLPGGARVADYLRDKLTIEVPCGYKRLRNDWTETPDKTRINFTIIDKQVEGDPLPQHIVRGGGNRSLSISFADGGGAKADYSVSASYTVDPRKHPGAAAIAFFLLAAKEADNLKKRAKGGAIIPGTFTANHSLYEERQSSSFSISWIVTHCLTNFEFSGLIYDDIPDNDYGLWRKSVEGTWINRGTSEFREVAKEDAIISICNEDNPIDKAKFGYHQCPFGTDLQDPKFKLACPTIEKEQSWLHYDIRVRYWRQDSKKTHRRAVKYEPQQQTSTGSGFAEEGIELDQGWTSDSAKQHVEEYDGLPNQLILLQFKAVRVKFKPNFPKLESIGGKEVTDTKWEQIEGPWKIADFGCPVYAIRGWKLYRVLDHVKKIEKAPPDPNNCTEAQEGDEEPPKPEYDPDY